MNKSSILAITLSCLVVGGCVFTDHFTFVPKPPPHKYRFNVKTSPGCFPDFKTDGPINHPFPDSSIISFQSLSNGPTVVLSGNWMVTENP